MCATAGEHRRVCAAPRYMSLQCPNSEGVGCACCMSFDAESAKKDGDGNFVQDSDCAPAAGAERGQAGKGRG